MIFPRTFFFKRIITAWLFATLKTLKIMPNKESFQEARNKPKLIFMELSCPRGWVHKKSPLLPSGTFPIMLIRAAFLLSAHTVAARSAELCAANFINYVNSISKRALQILVCHPFTVLISHEKWTKLGEIFAHPVCPKSDYGVLEISPPQGAATLRRAKNFHKKRGAELNFFHSGKHSPIRGKLYIYFSTFSLAPGFRLQSQNLRDNCQNKIKIILPARALPLCPLSSVKGKPNNGVKKTLGRTHKGVRKMKEVLGKIKRKSSKKKITKANTHNWRRSQFLTVQTLLQPWNVFSEILNPDEN